MEWIERAVQLGQRSRCRCCFFGDGEETAGVGVGGPRLVLFVGKGPGGGKWGSNRKGNPIKDGDWTAQSFNEKVARRG